MQRVGVRYFEDLQRRIPRTEVAVIEAAVLAKVVELLRCADAPDADRLFARAVGRCEPAYHPELNPVGGLSANAPEVLSRTAGAGYSPVALRPVIALLRGLPGCKIVCGERECHLRVCTAPAEQCIRKGCCRAGV